MMCKLRFGHRRGVVSEKVAGPKLAALIDDLVRNTRRTARDELLRCGFNNGRGPRDRIGIDDTGLLHAFTGADCATPMFTL